MINFPGSTRVGKRFPKKAFYEHLPLMPAPRAKFVSDVDRIAVKNSSMKSNLDLIRETEVKEVMLLSITLKKRDFDGKTVEVIARQNPHRLIFLFCYRDNRQLAVYHDKLHRTDWVPEGKVRLSLSGDNLDAIWDDLLQQMAVHPEAALGQEGRTTDDQLKTQDETDCLNRLIRKTETAAWKEQQPKKRFELYTRLQEYKKQLEEIVNG